jgi:hypothetical protein
MLATDMGPNASLKLLANGVLALGIMAFSMFLLFQDDPAKLLDETGFEQLSRTPKLWIARTLLFIMFSGGLYIFLLSVRNFKKSSRKQ